MSRRITVGSLFLAASIFTAELHAILAVAKRTIDLRNHYVLYCDSRSDLQVIKNINIITSRSKEGSRLSCTDVKKLLKITLYWLSAYVGSSVIDRADWRAKAAATYACDVRFPLPHTDLEHSIRSCLPISGGILIGIKCEKLEMTLAIG